jgi:choline dehydrogenase-like flavoprotein
VKAVTVKGQQAASSDQHDVIVTGSGPGGGTTATQLAKTGGISPEWPIGYDELEPCYVQADHQY